MSAAVLNKLTLPVVSFNRELNRARSVNMKNRRMVSSLVSGAVALLILGGHAKQGKAEAVEVNAGPAGNEWTKSYGRPRGT